MSGIYLSLVFPAYNEELRLPRSLEKTVAYLKRQSYSSEIIVVDDGSSDRTADGARSVLDPSGIPFKVISLDTNRGKGFAVKTGMEAAAGEYVFFSDSDLSTPIEELERLLPLLEKEYDVAIGSRGMKESKLEVRQPFLREYGGRSLNLLVQLIAMPGIKDTQCGFKGFRAVAAKQITSRQKLSGYSFDVEILYIARKLGMKIAEVPITWRNDPATKVSAVREGIKIVIDSFRIRKEHGK